MTLPNCGYLRPTSKTTTLGSLVQKQRGAWRRESKRLYESRANNAKIMNILLAIITETVLPSFHFPADNGICRTDSNGNGFTIAGIAKGFSDNTWLFLENAITGNTSDSTRVLHEHFQLSGSIEE